VVYKLIVSNPTVEKAHMVRVRQLIPKQGRFVKANPQPNPGEKDDELIWKLGTLDSGATREIDVTFQATGNGDLETSAWVQFEYGQIVVTRLESPLQIKTSGPSSVMMNDTFTLTTVVSHRGTSPLNDVVVNQTVPAGAEFLNSQPAAVGDNPLQWRLGKMDPGTTKTITMQFVARKSGPMETRATVTSGTQKRDADWKFQVGQVTLELTEGGPDRRVVGRNATYFLNVHNRGTSPATNVRLTHKLDPNVEFLSADSNGSLSQGEVRWLIPSLGPGERRTVSMVLRALRAGDLTARSEAVVDRVSTGYQASKLTRFTNPRDLMVEVDKIGEPVRSGDQTSIGVKLLNFGAKTYKGLVVAITFPPELLILDSKGVTGSTKQGQTVVFAPMAALPPNQEPSFSVFVKPIKAGEARIRVEAKSPDLPDGQILYEESLLIVDPQGATPARDNPALSGLPGGLPG